MKIIEGKEIFSVSEVNSLAKKTLELLTFWVEGEIYSLRKNPNWNFYYLDLKDKKALLPCIADAYMLDALEDDPVGLMVLAYGNLSLYEPFGKYQFKIAKVEKAGEGLLQKQLEELIKKLRGEGLFDKKYKKEIPKYPKKICVVTSAGSDAYNDFIRHTTGKFPIIELYTADVRVQGPKSTPNLLKVLPKVDSLQFDVVVITRGGGSIEDLAAFNDEKVARAIFALKTPTVVAIGHEANESLAEWVADTRASTPTDAANIVTSSYNFLLSSLESIKYRLNSKSYYYYSANLQRLDHFYFRLQQIKVSFKDLPQKLKGANNALKIHQNELLVESPKLADGHIAQIQKEFALLIQNKSQKLQNLKKSLLLLSPENTLKRGYSITSNGLGKIITNSKDVVVGESIRVKLAQGKLKSIVTSKK